MSTQRRAVPLSDSESDNEDFEAVQKRIKLMKERSIKETNRKRFSGGILFDLESESKDQSATASLSAEEKKGIKEVAELKRELDLRNTFSKETNRRDEDAEMKKYIDDQMKMRRDELRRERPGAMNSQKNDDEFADLFTMPAEAINKIDDILLHSLSKNLASVTDERSEAMLSSQMLNGIPEVDLGIGEKIRTIEATEEAKLRLATKSDRRSSNKKISSAPVNYSSNFQQHRMNRDIKDGELHTTRVQRVSNNDNRVKTITEPVVVVGEEPNEVEYKAPSSSGHCPPSRGKASDDYFIAKFKKNMRRSN